MSTAQTARAPSPATLPRHRGDPPRRLVPWLIDHRAQILTMIAVVAIAAGALLHLIGAGSTGKAVWGAAVALLAAELSFEVGRSIIVERSLGVDTIALVAMVGSLALNQELAGAVIGLMFSSGAALETIATTGAARADGTYPARAEGRPAPGRWSAAGGGSRAGPDRGRGRGPRRR